MNSGFNLNFDSYSITYNRKNNCMLSFIMALIGSALMLIALFLPVLKGVFLTKLLSDALNYGESQTDTVIFMLAFVLGTLSLGVAIAFAAMKKPTVTLICAGASLVLYILITIMAGVYSFGFGYVGMGVYIYFIASAVCIFGAVWQALNVPTNRRSMPTARNGGFGGMQGGGFGDLQNGGFGGMQGGGFGGWNNGFKF